MSRVWMNGFALLLAALSAGCGEENIGSGSGGNGGDGTTASNGGNGGGTTAATTTMAATTTSIMTTSSSWTVTTTGTQPVNDCDPPAPEGSLFALTDVDLNEDLVSMCKYRGDVLLIVNAAEA